MENVFWSVSKKYKHIAIKIKKMKNKTIQMRTSIRAITMFAKNTITAMVGDYNVVMNIA